MVQFPKQISNLRGTFRRPQPVQHRAEVAQTQSHASAQGALNAPSSGEPQPGAALEPQTTQDAELIVAVFRTMVLLIALLLPRVLNFPIASETDSFGGLSSQIWLAVVTGAYNIATGIACLFPSRFGLRRPFIVVMDGLLITAWIRFSGQWELFPFYYIVVVVAAMWFRVLGGVLAAAFSVFFYFMFYWGGMGDPILPYGPVLPMPLVVNASLLFLVGALVGYIAEAQENERQHRLESQLLIANYQREIDLSTQLQPLLISQEWSGELGESLVQKNNHIAPGFGQTRDPDLEIGAAMKTARVLGGGDYFDVISLEGGRTALCIADVSGKSVRAQARLPLLKYSLRALAPFYSDPEALVGRLNETLAPDLQGEIFIALCYVILDPRRNVLSWCNAGHIAPLVISRHTDTEDNQTIQNGLHEPGVATNGNSPETSLHATTGVPASGGAASIVDLGVHGPPLGMFPELPYRSGSLSWCPHDELLLFTDGLTDAFSYGDSEDGEEQIRHLATRLIAAAPAEEHKPNRHPPDTHNNGSHPLEGKRSVRAIAQDLVDLATTVLDVSEPRSSYLQALLPPLLRRNASEPESKRQNRDDITVVIARFTAQEAQPEMSHQTSLDAMHPTK